VSDRSAWNEHKLSAALGIFLGYFRHVRTKCVAEFSLYEY
jgi:hypothetical protein